MKLTVGFREQTTKQKAKMLAKIAVIIVVGIVFAASCEKKCDKEDPNSNCYVPPVQNDPNKELIERLEKDSIPAAERNFRNAFSIAMNSPVIPNYFWPVFNSPNFAHLSRITFADTVELTKAVIEELWKYYGNPLPYDSTEFQNLHEACKEYIRLIEKLKELKIAVYGVDYAKSTFVNRNVSLQFGLMSTLRRCKKL